MNMDNDSGIRHTTVTQTTTTPDSPWTLVATPPLAVLFFPVFLLFAVYNGWAISTLWGWFVTPLGVMDIGVWHAAGLVLVWHRFVNQTKVLKGQEGSTFTNIAMWLYGPILAVGYGWVIHTWLM